MSFCLMMFVRRTSPNDPPQANTSRRPRYCQHDADYIGAVGVQMVYGMTAGMAVDNLRYFASKANELQILRDRVEELESLLGLSADNGIWRLGFTPTQTAFLGMLFTRKLVRRQEAYTGIFGVRSECDQPQDQNLDVQLSRMRKKLHHLGVSVEAVRGVGWTMTENNKERLRTIIREKASE